MLAPSEEDVVTAARVMAELYGKNLSQAGAMMLLADLRGFSPAQILKSMERCRKELRAFPTVADIVSRIDDGRPGIEEAWGMIPKDEDGSVVWTDEMAEAFGVARALLLEGDPIAARMAFKEIYSRLVADARATGRPARWTPSLGHSQSGREQALRDAQERGRISADIAQSLIGHNPMPRRPGGSELTQIGETVRRALPDNSGAPKN